VDGFKVRLPSLEILFCICKDLSCISLVSKWLAGVTRYDWGVIEKVQETTTVSGQNDLLFGTLDGRSEMDIVGFLDLLTSL
jgi:hypothetical protein